MANQHADIIEDSFSSDAEFDEDVEESSSDVEAKLEEDDVFDVEFLKCYSALKKKDHKIYDKNVRFFDDNESTTDEENKGDDEESMDAESTSTVTKQKKAAPKMTLLDHQLAVMKDDVEDPGIERFKVDLNKEVTKSFYEKELEEIKQSIEKVGVDIDSESDEDLLIVKGDTNTKIKSKSTNKIKTILDKIEDEGDEDLQHLKKVWIDSRNLSGEDKFLRDYILNKRYLSKSAEAGDADDEDEAGFFSKNIDELSDADDENEDERESKLEVAAHRSDEQGFDKIARIPRNSTKTIRDLIEKQEKKEKRLKRLEKQKRRKKALKEADCEDILGDMPTKFHYRETEPNDYGLTAEELLMATDEELDKWVSLRECVAYKTPQEELAQKERFSTKRNNTELKRKIFKSVYSDTAGDQTGGDADQSTISTSSGTKRKKKKMRSKKRKRNSDSESSYKESANNSTIESSSHPPPGTSGQGATSSCNLVSKRQQKKKKKIRGLKNKKFANIGVAPDRLLAYGLSKTKLKKSKIL